MTELLTESFCERCGTRYELGAAEPLSRTQKTRGLMSGLKQFIMSQDTLSDSIGDAMRAEEDAIAARQIEVFQNTFNFCLDCRQYTCSNCWNEGAGRCRSCVPVPGVDDIAGYERRLAAALGPAAVEVTEPAPAPPVEEPWPDARPLPASAWPSEDAAVRAPAPEAIEPVVPEPEPPMVPEPLAAVEPVEAFEPIQAVEPVETEVPGAPELAASAPGEAIEPEVEAPAPPVEPAPTPRPARRDLRDTFVRGPQRPTRAPAGPTEGEPAQLAARRSQLDILGIDDPGEGTVPVGQRTQLPYRSSGAGVGGSPTLAAVWDASTRYLEAGALRASLRDCGSCGLTVSSTARFCRRCGAPQTLSA